MKKNPLISVIIPVFNRAKTIGRAIESCFSQGYHDIEVLVINDHSSDNTDETTKSFDDKRIRYFSHAENRGPAAARNTGIRNAKGRFIAFLDSDDEWLPCKISRQLEVFVAEPKIGLVFVNGYNEAEKRDFIQDKASGIVYNPERDAFFPLSVLICPPSAWMIPKEIIFNVGYFDERMYNWDDGDYLARVAYKYSIYFLNQNLVIWHKSFEHVNKMSVNLIKGKELFLENNFNFMKTDKEYLFKFYRSLGKDLLLFNKKKARAYLFEAFKLNPIDSSTISKIIKSFIK